jgi:hypothetical protein
MRYGRRHINRPPSLAAGSQRRSGGSPARDPEQLEVARKITAVAARTFRLEHEAAVAASNKKKRRNVRVIAKLTRNDLQDKIHLVTSLR